MGLFSFFQKKNSVNEIDHPVATGQKELPDIPHDVFVQKDEPDNEKDIEKNNPPPAQNGITVLFQFLEKNHEAKGYNDALTNPDGVHLEQNVEALRNELERTIRKIKIFYDDFIREINFHISSRSRNGMVDTVEELIVKKETAANHIQQVIEIETDAKNNTGVAQGIVISYTRGFRNGLAAISGHSIMKKNF